MDKVLIESRDIFTNNRIEIDQGKLKDCRERKNFKELENNVMFQERVLKGCWVQQLIITIRDITMGERANPFSLVIDFERLPNC